MIELCALTIRYPGRPAVTALDAVSLRLMPGLTFIRGPSGAGKSTLLRALAGLQPLSGGAIRYPWRPRTAAGVRSRVGYVPQDNRLTLRLTSEDALRHLAAVRGQMAGRGAAAGLLALWGLAPVRGERLARLSSGQARRWLLAQSQLAAPTLWLLDEPLHGLDASAVQTLRAELRAFAATLRYAVVVSHDPRLDDLAQRIVRLKGGRVVGAASSPPSPSRPCSPSSRGLSETAIAELA